MNYIIGGKNNVGATGTWAIEADDKKLAIAVASARGITVEMVDGKRVERVRHKTLKEVDEDAIRSERRGN